MSFVNSYHTMEQTFDYRHELLNRQMALRAKLKKARAIAGCKGMWIRPMDTRYSIQFMK